MSKLDKLRNHYIKEEGFDHVEIYESEWWQAYKPNLSVEQYLRLSFPSKMQLRERDSRKLLRTKSSLVMFNAKLKYQRISLKILQTFHQSSGTLSLTELTRVLSWNKTPSEGLSTHPRKMFIWNLFLENETKITSSLFFSLDLDWCEKNVALWSTLECNCSRTWSQVSSKIDSWISTF